MGPIFDKELRVSSRRRRNYVLRFTYLLFLTLFVAIVWLSQAGAGGSRILATSQMALAGRIIISTIIIFQFFATQLIALVMLSTGISDEIYHRTLGVLMTTPISSFQIVMGKLFSKLLQIILLMAISLPLLAIVRVFGGVPWNYIISSLCLTLTMIIFTGSLSLYFSISRRRAFAIILKTLFVLGVLFAFIPGMVVLLQRNLRMPDDFEILFFYLNPYLALSHLTDVMHSPIGLAAVKPLFWPYHCLIMLTASLLLLSRVVVIVRAFGIRQATGQLDLNGKAPRPKKTQSKIRPTTSRRRAEAPIRTVEGSPIIWKELRAPFIQGGQKRGVEALIITVGILLLTYGATARTLNEDYSQLTYILVFVLLGLVFNVVLPATCITGEKESRTWPLLLATALDDWHILLGKAIGVLRRCLPIWLFLAGHVIFFTFMRYIHPIALVHLTMLIFWVFVFLSGTGLYFSTLFRRTTTAVVANLSLALFLWGILPGLLAMTTGIFRTTTVFETCLAANPIVQSAVITMGAAGPVNAGLDLVSLHYSWYNSHNRWDRIGPTTAVLFCAMLGYGALGGLFAWRAKARMRRGIF